MDGHAFQIEQNIHPSRNFEPRKLMEPHLLVPNTKVEGICFEEGSFGLLSTPRRPILPLSQLFYVPRKAVITKHSFVLLRHFLSAVVDVYSEFLDFYIQHDVDIRKWVGVKTIKLSWPNKNGLNGGFEFRSQFCDFPQI